MNVFETAKQFFLEGIRSIESKNYEAAEKQFALSLELIPDRISTLNNLSVVKIRLGKFADAEELARKAATLDDKSPEAWSNLGIALTRLKRNEEALQANDQALKFNPSNAAAWLNKAMTLLELKRYDEALPACERALELNPSQYEALYQKSQVLKQLDRLEEAKMAYLEWFEARAASSPLFIADRNKTQKADVLVINRNPVIDSTLKSFEALLLGINFPGQLSGLLNEDFHFIYVFERDAVKPVTRKQIPQPDLLINNDVNGEDILLQDKLTELVQLVDSFKVPVVNHPTKAIKTTRDESVRLLGDVSGILVPKTIRFPTAGKSSKELVCEIEQQFDYPLILRTLVSQEGKGMTKVDSREALVGNLASGFPEAFLVTQFVDSRGGNEYFRKIRAAVVKDEIIIMRVDYDSNWNVHGRKSDERVAFYLNNAALLDQEQAICAAPEEKLGRSVIQSLRAIRDRIPLDAFGIDFDVNADGALVFYEANATMNLFSTAREEVPYPKDGDERLKLALKRYFLSLVTRS
jgi:Flp pilus assembly protein TadD